MNSKFLSLRRHRQAIETKGESDISQCQRSGQWRGKLRAESESMTELRVEVRVGGEVEDGHGVGDRGWVRVRDGDGRSGDERLR